jgi:hypothetical protein
MDWSDVDNINMRPIDIRKQDYVPCSCKKCFFCKRELTHGVNHKKKVYGGHDLPGQNAPCICATRINSPSTPHWLPVQLGGYASKHILDVQVLKPLFVLAVGAPLNTVTYKASSARRVTHNCLMFDERESRARLEGVPVEMCIISTRFHEDVSFKVRANSQK